MAMYFWMPGQAYSKLPTPLWYFQRPYATLGKTADQEGSNGIVPGRLLLCIAVTPVPAFGTPPPSSPLGAWASATYRPPRAEGSIKPA
jgi:hypothetical protein